MGESGARAPMGSGVLSVVQAVANPAAGADFTAAPAGTRQLLAVTATLVTAATVANRLPQLQVVDAAANILVRLAASSVQAASLTETYTWGIGLPFASGNNQNMVPIPAGLVIPPTWTVQAVTAAIQAADQWSNVVYTWAG